MTKTVMKQCKKCPWLKAVDPHDIPGGYCENKHRSLNDTISKDISIAPTLRMMACHETPIGSERPCVGWLHNQLGPGNNLALRIWAMTHLKGVEIQLVGVQHENFEETLP